jgi:hypothetical protein
MFWTHPINPKTPDDLVRTWQNWISLSGDMYDFFSVDYDYGDGLPKCQQSPIPAEDFEKGTVEIPKENTIPLPGQSA